MQLYLKYYNTFSIQQAKKIILVNYFCVSDCYFTYRFRVGYTYSIRSPGYEGPFPENLKCVYVISYSMGFTTGISFESFGLSSAQDGSCTDYVKVSFKSSCSTNASLLSSFQITLLLNKTNIMKQSNIVIKLNVIKNLSIWNIEEVYHQLCIS